MKDLNNNKQQTNNKTTNNKQQKIMKKYFVIAAAAALVLGACSKNIIDETSTGNVIGFSTYSPTPTKAGGSFVTGTNFLGVNADDQLIGVYAYNTGSATYADATHTPNFMTDVKVKLLNNGGTASSSYTPVRYWPTDEANNKLTFFAYYPNLTGNNITKTVGIGLVDFSFSIPDTKPINDIDFMVADAVIDQVYSSNTGVVPFVFRHQLTQVNFFVNTDNTDANTTIKIKTVKVLQIKTSGKLTSTYSSGTTTEWGTLGGKTDFIIYNVAAGAALSTAAQQIGETADSYYCGTEVNAYRYLMIPQEIGDDVKVEIVYDVITDGVTTTNTFTGDAAKKLNTAGSITAWGKNQKINYTITVGLKPIEFTATVETGWTPESSGGLTF
jgi:hypothetical protein